MLKIYYETNSSYNGQQYYFGQSTIRKEKTFSNTEEFWITAVSTYGNPSLRRCPQVPNSDIQHPLHTYKMQ